jgi:hypothetical protein
LKKKEDKENFSISNAVFVYDFGVCMFFVGFLSDRYGSGNVTSSMVKKTAGDEQNTSTICKHESIRISLKAHTASEINNFVIFQKYQISF